jgi:hypothetical protein
VLPLALLWVQLVDAQNASPPSTAGVQDAASNLVKMHDVWGAKASTPNTLLTIKEFARSGKIVKFRLYAEGAAKDQIYSIVTWPVTQRGPSEQLTGVTLDANGLAICAGTPGTCGGDKPNDPIDLIFMPAPGEPVRLGLVSQDGATKMFAKAVPVPLHGEDRGCTIDAVLLTAQAELVLIEGSGFPANGEVNMDSESAGERHSGQGKVDANGRYMSAILPYKLGVQRGTLKAALKSAGCSPSVSVPWGRGN